MAPTYPSYHAAQSLLGLKAAWEKAQAKKGGARPSTDEVIAAFEGLEFQTPSTTIRLAIGKGHQGISDISYGTNRFNKAEGRPEIVDVVHYPAECVNPPPDVDSQAWLEGGMKGAKCN
jgi:branched-chain amino acid transport system substrate-binding protein